MAFQIGSSLLDALVLGILNKESTYGYVLTQQAKLLMDISDSTLYPVLKRLLKDDALYTYDVPYQGRNRRYYSITDKGKQMLENYINDWHSYKVLVEQLLTGGIHLPPDETAESRENEGDE